MIANSFLSVIILVLILTSGFAITPSSIPPWWIWIYWISPFSWAFRAGALNEFLSDDPSWSALSDPQVTHEACGGVCTVGQQVNGEWQPSTVCCERPYPRRRQGQARLRMQPCLLLQVLVSFDMPLDRTWILWGFLYELFLFPLMSVLCSIGMQTMRKPQQVHAFARLERCLQTRF